MNISLPLRTRRVVAAALLVAATAGCNIAKPAAPSLTGPSEFGLSVTLRATPEILLRDGASISTIRVSVYDERGQPKNGQRLVLATSAGTLSTLNVTTGSDGQTEFEVRAPGINEDFSSLRAC